MAIAGKLNVTNIAVETHKNSYKLEQLTVVSVRRPFLPLALMIAFGGSAFGWRFYDLMYASELLTLGGTIISALLVGTRVAQLQLLSRDLRGSELTSAIWGTYGHLNRARHRIMAHMGAVHEKTLS